MCIRDSPHCAECTNIFSSGGGKKLSEQFSVPYLGNIPIDPKFVEMIENQASSEKTLVEMYKESSLCPIFQEIMKKLREQDIKTRTMEKHD